MVLAVVIFFESAIVFGYFDTLSIWLQIVGALFGVVLSAIITMLLLSGQSRNALEKERSAEIFREKLRIYQEYLHRLCDILRDGEITSEEAIELQFLTSYISLHTDSKNIKEICVNTSNMVSNYIGEHAQKSTQDFLQTCTRLCVSLEKSYMLLVLSGVKKISRVLLNTCLCLIMLRLPQTLRYSAEGL